MDSLTHIAIGACIGEAFFEKGFGKKVIIWGILAQSIPDIDFIAGFWFNTPDTLFAHRGITHSILFAVFIIPLFALLADKVHRPHNIPFKTWILFFGTEVFAHLFLDGFNNYGVGWFEPFSHKRFSFNSIYVADPFFSIWAGIAFVMLLILNARHTSRKIWWKCGIYIPLIYLSYCILNKFKIDRDVNEILQKQHIAYTTYFTTPAPLQNWLWYVVVANHKGYYIGYRSVFDSKKQINFHYVSQNKNLLKTIKNSDDVKKLIRFSQGFYTIEKNNDTLIFNDLRFGQIVGWQNPDEKFAFHYYLQYPNDNKLVVQRGRFAKWNWTVTQSFWMRIKGN